MEQPTYVYQAVIINFSYKYSYSIRLGLFATRHEAIVYAGQKIAARKRRFGMEYGYFEARGHRLRIREI